MKKEAMDQILLNAEELDDRIAPGLTTDLSLVDIGTIICPPPPEECPPPPPEEECPPTESETDGGNNGYGNDGHDGVPGGSADNDSPNSDEKEADQVR